MSAQTTGFNSWDCEKYESFDCSYICTLESLKQKCTTLIVIKLPGCSEQLAGSWFCGAEEREDDDAEFAH